MGAKLWKKANKAGIPSALLAIGLYVVARLIKHSPSMPSLSKILSAGAEIISSPAFYSNLFYTIKIVLIGITISFVFGAILAILCSMVDWLNDLIMPIINSTKNIPSIALFPLFIVLMGIGDEPRIFVIIWNSVYPIISSTFVGLNSPDKEVIDAAQNCGATKWQVYKYIRIPLAMLDMLNGLKISIGNGFIAIVVAEMLGATKGLGYMVLWSSNAFQYPQMYIYILVIALIGFLVNVVIEKIIRMTERKIYYGTFKKDRGNRSNCGNHNALYDGVYDEADKRSSQNEVCRAQGL